MEQINTQISQGTATEDKVLSGFTFSSSCGKNVEGTMINQGELNWNPATEDVYNVPAGYYSGGTLSSSNAYNSGYNLGYEAGITNSNVKVILLGTLGNSFNLSSYENFQNFKIGEHIFFVPSSMSVTVYNNFEHYYTGSSHSDDVLGASSSGTNNSLLNYDSNTGLLTTSTTASTGNAQVKEYDGHGYNFDAADASAKVTIAGNVYLVF